MITRAETIADDSAVVHKFDSQKAYLYKYQIRAKESAMSSSYDVYILICMNLLQL